MPKTHKEPLANIAPFGLRMQPDLKARVARHAQQNNRSMNSEIINLIEFAIWQADMGRMHSGLEPLREVTDEDWEIINFAREVADRHKKPTNPSRESESIPFFGDEPPPSDETEVRVFKRDGSISEVEFARVLAEENRKAFAAAMERLGIKQIYLEDLNKNETDK